MSSTLTELLRANSDHAAAPDSLDGLLRQLAETARATWPTFDVPLEEFVAHLGKRLPSDLPPPQALRQIYTSDLFLACGCARGDARAIAAFEEHCLGVIDRALPKLGYAPDVVSEVKQRVRDYVLVGAGRPPAIGDFAGRGKLRSWVRAMAVNEAMGMALKQRKEAPLDEDALLHALVVPSNPELEHLKRLYRQEFKQAFDVALRGLDDREHMILRQHFVDGLTIDELGLFYRVHRSTAARTLDRARRALLDGTRAQLGDRLRVRPSELDSILRIIRSRLSVSLRLLLRRRRR